MPTAREKLAGKRTKLATVQERLEDHPANLNSYQEGDFFNVDISLVLPEPEPAPEVFRRTGAQ